MTGRGATAEPDAGTARLRARPLASLRDLEPSRWDAVVPPGHAPLRHGFLSAFEQTELPGLTSAPIVATAGGHELSAACPGYVYDLDLLGSRLPRATGALGLLRRRWPHLLTARTYELGSPTPLTNPFLVREEARRPEAVSVLCEAAINEAARRRAQFVLVQNLSSPSGPAAGALAPLGFATIPILPTVVVPLSYGSFDEYLAAMRSQYRRRATKTLTRSAELRIEHRRQFAELAPDLARLWHLVYDRADELRREVLTPGYFRAVSTLDHTSVLLARHADGSLASFALLLSDRPWMWFLHCGFDEAAGRSEGAYFRLLYEIVRVAIGDGVELLDLGMTTVQPKLDVGGVPVPLYALVKHRNRLAHRAVVAFANGPARPPVVEPRRVFKGPVPSAGELLSR